MVDRSVGRPDVIVCHLLFLYISPSPTIVVAVEVAVASSSRYAAASAVTDTTGTNVCLQYFLSSIIHLQYLDTTTTLCGCAVQSQFSYSSQLDLSMGICT